MSKSESRTRGLLARGVGVIAASGLLAFAAPAATPVVGTALVASADAATYDLKQCSAENRGVAGWTPSFSGAYVYYGNDCPSGGWLMTSFDASLGHVNGDAAYWTFDAPANTTLEALFAERQMRSGTPHPNGFGNASGVVLKNGGTVVENCVRLFGCTTLFSAQGYPLDGANSVAFGIQCTGQNGCPADTVYAGMRSLTVRLNDALAPAVSGVSGSLTSTSTTTRTRQLAFTATDQGGGVYRRRLVIDDVPQATAVIDGNGGQCAEPFSLPVPCKTSVSESFSFDTIALSDGTHDISLRVTDATDVNRAQSSEWTIKVDNLPPSFGDPTVSGEKAQVGVELTCSAGPISGQSPTVSYQWLRANADGSGQAEIAGATSSKYTPTVQDEQKKLLCRVSAQDQGGTTTKTSSTTSGPFGSGATVQPAPVQPQPTPTPEPPASCPSTPTGVGTGPTEDHDGDRIPNCADDDDDGDNVPDTQDPEPFNPLVPEPPKKDPTPNPGSGAGSGSAPVSGAGSQAEKVNGENGSASAVLAASWLKGRTRGQTTRYGTSATIRGQLSRPDGVKVDDAKIELVYLEAGATRDMGGARTRKDGSFVIKLPSNSPSRKLQLRYRYDLSKQDVTSKVDLTLTVRATARLSVVKRPGALRLTGRIGAPGKLGSRKVTIQYRTAGRAWRPFLTLRTTSAGKFSGRYRLAAPLRGRVQFRAVVGSAGSHIGGASPTRKVRF